MRSLLHFQTYTLIDMFDYRLPGPARYRKNISDSGHGICSATQILRRWQRERERQRERKRKRSCISQRQDSSPSASSYFKFHFNFNFNFKFEPATRVVARSIHPPPRPHTVSRPILEETEITVMRSLQCCGWWIVVKIVTRCLQWSGSAYYDKGTKCEYELYVNNPLSCFFELFFDLVRLWYFTFYLHGPALTFQSTHIYYFLCATLMHVLIT